MEYLLLLIGFVLLIKGADFFVDGSSSLAKNYEGTKLLLIGTLYELLRMGNQVGPQEAFC